MDKNNNLYQVIKEEDLDEILSDNIDKHIIVMFSSSDCKPCKTIKPIYTDLSKKYKNYFFVYIDNNKFAESDKKYIDKFNFMPHFVFYYNKQETSNFIGAKKELLLDTLKKLEKNKKVIKNQNNEKQEHKQTNPKNNEKQNNEKQNNEKQTNQKNNEKLDKYYQPEFKETNPKNDEKLDDYYLPEHKQNNPKNNEKLDNYYQPEYKQNNQNKIPKNKNIPKQNNIIQHEMPTFINMPWERNQEIIIDRNVPGNSNISNIQYGYQQSYPTKNDLIKRYKQLQLLRLQELQKLQKISYINKNKK